MSGIQIPGNTDLDQLNPARIPLLDPGTQSGAVSGTVHIQVAPADPVTGQTLTYSATGLPPGTSISTSGLITGTLTTAGTYRVTVRAGNGAGLSDSVSFSWDVATAAH